MGELRRITERYRLDRRIDTSGAGSVFQGAEIRSGDAVAVKLLDGGDSDEERERYDAYAAALGTLSQPGFPRFVDAGFTSAGSAYLVTGYVQGSPLAESTGAPPAHVLSLFLLVAEALEALAEAGWAHGNLQVDNVLVAPEPVGDQVKLLGLGTPVFRPGADLSAAAGYPADLRALALLACQLFRGTVTDEGGTEGIRLPAELAGGIEDLAGLSQVLSDALRGDPEGRLPSYRELRRLLRLSLPDLGLRTAVVRAPSGTAPGLATAVQPPGAGGWHELRLGSDFAALAGSGTVAEGSLASETMILQRLTDGPSPVPQPIPPPPPIPVIPPIPPRSPIPPLSPLSPMPISPLASPEHTRVMRMDEVTGGDPRIEALLRQRAAPPSPPEPTPTPPPLGGTVYLPVESLAPPAAAPPPPVERKREPVPRLSARPASIPVPAARPVPPPAPVPAPVIPPAPEPLAQPRPTAVPVPELKTVAVPVPAPTPALSQKPPRRPILPGRQRLWLLAGGGGAVLLALLVAGGIALHSRRSTPPPQRPAPVVHKLPPPPPAVTPKPAPAAPVNPQILLAEGQLVNGDLAGAKKTLESIPDDQKLHFTAEESDRFQKVLTTLAPIEAEQTAGHLSQALAAGDVRSLKAQVAALTPDQETALTPEVKKDLARARKILEADGRLTRAERSKEPLDVLRQAGLLLVELPHSSRASSSRERAAADVEADADKKLQDGDFDGSLARLQQLKDVWPERRGLAERVDRAQGEKKADQALEERLAAALRAEKQGKPADGLAALKGVEPNRRYADRFRQARERLEAQQLAALDRKPPEIVCPKSLKDLKYAKGAVITIPLRITDDLEVKSVDAWARPKDGTYVHLPVRQVAGADYQLEIQPALHDNKEVEFYVTATDRSGHEGHFGTAQEPKQIKRKWWPF